MNNRLSRRLFGSPNSHNARVQSTHGVVIPLEGDILVSAPGDEYYNYADVIVSDVNIRNFHINFEKVCTDSTLGNEAARKSILNQMITKIKAKHPNVLNLSYKKNEHLVHRAAYLGSWFAFEILVQNGAQISCLNIAGETALHSLLEGVCDGEITEDQAEHFLARLLENRLLSNQIDDKLNIDEQNEKGETVAYLAVKRKRDKIFQALLKIGANIDVECDGVTARSTSHISTALFKSQSKQPENMYSFLSIFKHHKSEIEILTKINKILKNNLSFGYLKNNLFSGAIEHGYYHVVKIMLNQDIKINEPLSLGDSIGVTPLFIAASRGYKKILKLLLERGADINIRHLETFNTVFHECADLPQPSTRCFRLLLQHAENTNQLHLINAQDYQKNTPLHLAGIRNNEEIIEALLEYKADAFLKNINKMPAFSYIDRAHIERHLDTYITCLAIENENVNSNKDANEEVTTYFTFDFTFLFPNSANKKVTGTSDNAYTASPSPRSQQGESSFVRQISQENYDYTEEMSSSSEEDEIYGNPDKVHEMKNMRKRKVIHSTEIKSLGPEMKILSLISKYENHRKLLLHPLIKSFLYLKWKRLSWIFYLNLSIYIAFTLFISNYIYDRVHSPEHFKNLTDSEYFKEIEAWKTLSWNTNSSIYDMLIKWMTLFTLIIFTVREFIQICLSFKKYIRDWINYLDWTIIILTLILLFVPLRHFHFYVTASTLILLSYLDLLFLIGSIPDVANYMKMFLSVSSRFFFFFVYFSILIVAFAVSFYIMFQKCTKGVNCSKNDIFSSGFIPSIFKTLMMMVGDYEYSDLKIFDVSRVTQLIFFLFVFFVSIVLLNLAIGLAVSDTEKIIRRSDIDYCIAQIKIFNNIEKVFFRKDKMYEGKRNFCFKNNSWLRKLLNLNVIDGHCSDKKCVVTLGKKRSFKLSTEFDKISHINLSSNGYSQQIIKEAYNVWLKKYIASDVQNIKNYCRKTSEKNKHKSIELSHEMKAMRKELAFVSNQLIQITQQFQRR